MPSLVTGSYSPESCLNFIVERKDEWRKRFLFLCACYSEHVRTQKQFMFIDGRTRFYHIVHPPCNHVECMRKMKRIKFPLFFVLVVHVKKHGITSNFYPETTKRINLFKQNRTRTHIQAEPHQ